MLYEVCGNVVDCPGNYSDLFLGHQTIFVAADRRYAKEVMMERFLSPWTGVVIAILIALALLRQFGQLNPLAIFALLAYLLLTALAPVFFVPFGLIVLLVIIIKYPGIVRF